MVNPLVDHLSTLHEPLPWLTFVPTTTSGLPKKKKKTKMSEHRLISSGSTFESQIGYSRAVVSGDWVFVSGCTG